MQTFILKQQNVFGLALNFADQLAYWDKDFHQPPYQAPPRASVVYILPANTFNQSGHITGLCSPAAAPLQAGPCLGVVIARTACRLTATNALAHVAGVLPCNDYSYPLTSYYRPDIRNKCMDGSLSAATELTPLQDIGLQKPFELRLSINGQTKQIFSSSQWVRSLTEILVELTEYMVLKEGDLILTGSPQTRFPVTPGDQVDVCLQGGATLSDTIVAGDTHD